MAVKFDPTINLGHVLTFAGMLAVGAGAWSTLEKRVSLLEVKTEAAVTRADERAGEINSKLGEIKQDMKDLRREVAPRAAERTDRR